jgi:hypothetical protein
MKTLLFSPLFFLFLCSCKNEPLPDEPNNYLPLPKIEVSEVPIWINEECQEKSIMVEIDEGIKKGLSFQIDGEVLVASEVQVKGKRHVFSLILPEGKRHKQLTIKSLGDKGVPISYPVQIHYFKQGDTLDFYGPSSFEKQLQSFFYPMECWPNYEGGVIKGGRDYGISYTYSRKDEVVGDSLYRTIKLSNMKFSSLDSKEEYRIEPAISRTFSVRNYAGLEPSNSVFGSVHKSVPGKDIGINTEFTVGLGLTAFEDGLPTYFIMGLVQGNQFKLRAKECFQYDTLEIVPLKLPGSYQIVLTKCDWATE